MMLLAMVAQDDFMDPEVDASKAQAAHLEEPLRPGARSPADIHEIHSLL